MSVEQTGFMVETIGIEPMTSCMSSKRSNHLGYASEACILYHSILLLSIPKMGFFESNHNKTKGFPLSQISGCYFFCIGVDFRSTKAHLNHLPIMLSLYSNNFELSIWVTQHIGTSILLDTRCGVKMNAIGGVLPHGSCR